MNLRKKLQKLTKKRGDNADTPWSDSMSNNSSQYRDPAPASSSLDGAHDANDASPSPRQPTLAAFSPNQQTASRTRAGTSVLIHQKSPLLVATPPLVTRALAYSHPFILPLNHVAGLLSWTTGDQWESFLLVAVFWFAVLYGDFILRWAAPLALVMVLIVGMYSRRYSPLSSTTWSGEKQTHRRASSDSEQRKTLDEIVDTLQTFTSRCDVLLDPFLRLTDFLSTQSSAKSATTRPALTTLFLRILALTPFWIAATLPPLRLITAQRTVLVLGTLGLTWHSRPTRVTRTILWRSRTVRKAASLLTGLHFNGPAKLSKTTSPLPARKKDALPTTIKATSTSPGVRFTFTLFENQRRWLGLGWTPSLLAYERQPWTDEHLNPCPEPAYFSLPTSENETMHWQWVSGSEWRIEGAEKPAKPGSNPTANADADAGWTYYDNKWRDARKTDGWGRYTRRRKWVRDAELVDSIASAAEPTPISTVADNTNTASSSPPADSKVETTSLDKRKQSWFGGGARRRESGKNRSADIKSDGASASGTGSSGASTGRDEGLDVLTPASYRLGGLEEDRSLGEGVAEWLS